MLLIDGVKYEEWTINNENKLTEDDLEQMVIEHSDEIFGQDSIFLDKKYKLKTITGVGSIPDGFSIVFSNQPEWHIVEVELSSHDIYEHVVNQVTKFMDGIENLNSKDNLCEAMWNAINNNYLLKHKLEKAAGSLNPHWFLESIIKKSLPTITLIIEREQRGLEGTLSKFTYLKHKIVEFQTFRRLNAEKVHAHLFEPIFKTKIPKTSIPDITIIAEGKPPGLGRKIIEINIQAPYIRAHYIPIRKNIRQLFPGYRIPFTLETDVYTTQTYICSAPGGTKIGDPDKGHYFQANLAGWFKQHRELKVGDKVRISIMELMKKYRLEIVK